MWWWWLWMGCSPIPAEPDAPDAAHDPLVSLLAARHTHDLPPRRVIDQHGGAVALATIAQTAPHVVTRIRALDRLQLYPDAVPHCVHALERPEHITVHVAALRCVAALQSPDSPELASIMASWRTHPDPRVQAVVDGVPAIDVQLRIDELPALQAPSVQQ